MTTDMKATAADQPTWTDADFETDPDECGVHRGSFEDALVTWVAMVGRGYPVPVADAARAWNTTPEIVRAAVNDETWAFLNGDDEIELDGE